MVPLGLDEQFGPKLSAAGKRAPDALVVGTGQIGPVIQPVDFKFSLDHAEAGQIGIDVTVAAGQLLEPSIGERIGRAIGHPRLDAWAEVVVTGALVAPPSASNRRTRVPGRPALRWLTAKIDEFFPSLPAADSAAWLARLDGLNQIEDDFDLAEAYYRLGAAVAGALGRLHRPLFADGAEVQPADLTAIEEWRARIGGGSAADLIESLRPEIAERRTREARLGQLLRRPAGREALNRAVHQPPESTIDAWPPEARRALRGALVEDRAAVLGQGQTLVSEGKSEEEVLGLLQSDFRRRSERFLHRLRERMEPPG